MIVATVLNLAEVKAETYYVKSLVSACWFWQKEAFYQSRVVQHKPFLNKFPSKYSMMRITAEKQAKYSMMRITTEKQARWAPIGNNSY